MARKKFDTFKQIEALEAESEKAQQRSKALHDDIVEASRDCIKQRFALTTSAIQLYLYFRDGSKELYTREEIREACTLLCETSPVFNSRWLDQ